MTYRYFSIDISVDKGRTNPLKTPSHLFHKTSCIYHFGQPRQKAVLKMQQSAHFRTKQAQPIPNDVSSMNSKNLHIKYSLQIDVRFTDT